MKALVKSNSADLFFEKAGIYWSKKIEEELYSKLIKNKELVVPIEILTSYICSTLIFLLKWWLNNKMQYSTTQMEKYFHELVDPSIEAIISKQI